MPLAYCPIFLIKLSLMVGTGRYRFWTLGRNRMSEIARAAPVARPHEATMPKACKNDTNRRGNGILSKEKIAFLERVNLALLTATNVESIMWDSVHNRVKKMKAAAKIAFSPTKLIAGDQMSKPVIKMPAISRLMSPLKVKQVFINC